MKRFVKLTLLACLILSVGIQSTQALPICGETEINTGQCTALGPLATTTVRTCESYLDNENGCASLGTCGFHYGISTTNKCFTLPTPIPTSTCTSYTDRTSCQKNKCFYDSSAPYGVSTPIVSNVDYAPYYVTDSAGVLLQIYNGYSLYVDNSTNVLIGSPATRAMTAAESASILPTQYSVSENTISVLANTIAKNGNPSYRADGSVGQCVADIASVMSRYTCAQFNNVLDASMCNIHGCTYNSISGICGIADRTSPVCPSVADASVLAQCYSVDTLCHWTYNTTTPACATGAPTVCEDFFTDASGCSNFGAIGTCAWNTDNNRCFTSPPACALIMDDVTCTSRYDCSSTTSNAGRFLSCASNGQATTGCGQFTTVDTCTGNCLWDPYVTTPSLALPGDAVVVGYPNTISSSDVLLFAGLPSLGQCFNSMIDINTLYSCDHWSYYNSPLLRPCAFHGCGINGAVCTSDSSINIQNTNVASVSVAFQVLNKPVLDPQTLTLSAALIIPLASFWVPTAPTYYTVMIGNVVGTDFTSYFSSPSASCSSLSALPAYSRDIPPSGFLDQGSLLSNFHSALTAGVLDRGTTSPADVATYPIIGGWSIGNGSIITSAFDTNNGFVGFNLGINLFDAVRNCGVSRTDTTGTNGATTWTAPITVIARTDGGSTAAATTNLIVSISTHGTVTMSASSNNVMRLSVEGVQDNKSADGTTISRSWTVRETFTSMDSAHVIGLRTLADVQITGGAGGGANNCFGTTALTVTPPTSCTAKANSVPGFDCVTLITFQTASFPVALADSLNTCQDRTQASLDTVQSFYDRPYAWLTGLDPSLSSTAATFAGTDTVGQTPDHVVISIKLAMVAPVAAQAIVLSVLGGFFPTPQSSLTDFLLGGANTTVTLGLNAAFTPVIYMPVPYQLATYTLTMDTSSIIVRDLDINGLLLGNSIGWNDMKTTATKLTRSSGTAPNRLIDVQAHLGEDGWSLPVTQLRKLLPLGTGYQVTVDWNVIIPAAGSTPSASRRLLSMMEEPTSQGRRLLQLPTPPATSGSSVMSFNVGSNLDSIVVPQGGVAPPIGSDGTPVVTQGTDLINGVPKTWATWLMPSLIVLFVYGITYFAVSKVNKSK